MGSSRLEDYEVLSILGADLNSTSYKVKHKKTGEIFVWKAISYECLIESEKQALLARIEKHKLLEHPHLLKVYDYILHEEGKVLYLVSEFCANGNLNCLIQKCMIEGEYLSEDFLWRIIYQIACALKIKGNLSCSLSLNNIFLDGDYKVKLFHDEVLGLGEKPIDDLCFGRIIFDLCSLNVQKFAKANSVAIIKQFLTSFPQYYSNELKEIVKFLLTVNFDTQTIIDTILCHPTILLKSSQAKITPIYIKKPKEDLTTFQNISNMELEKTSQVRLENLKNREAALKIREEKLHEKAHELHKREKKIALTERTVREKLLQAELYLKRSREPRNKISYETIDTSLSGADSTFTAPTTFHKKPPHFVRTMSDRRVRFKGHSPLKEMCVRNNFNPKLHQSINTIKENSSITSSDKSHEDREPLKKPSRKKLDLFSMLPSVRSRKPLDELNKEGNENVRYECRPISWTEENKQHAFELLRIMNQGDENEIIKHTYL